MNRQEFIEKNQNAVAENFWKLLQESRKKAEKPDPRRRQRRSFDLWIKNGRGRRSSLHDSFGNTHVFS